MEHRINDRRKLPRAPRVQFRAGLHGKAYDNVNFARSEAEGMANGLGSDVTLYQLVDGRALALTTVRPDGA